MSSLTDKLTELISPGPSGSDIRATNTPESWRPRLEIDPEKGEGYFISTPRPAGNSPDGVELLKEFDLDPSDWTITSIRKSRWQNHKGDWLEAFRASLVPTSTKKSSELDFDLEKLIQDVSKWRPSKVSQKITGDLAFIFAPSDQQIGKKQGDVGTDTTVSRLLTLTEMGVQRLHELRKIGRPIGTVVIPLPGDHVEGIVSQNGRVQGQAASDLGITEQTRLARRVLMAQIKAFAPLAERIIVPVVNGNHDEAGRQVITDPSDGWNVEIASAVQDACAENENLSHVEFRFPEKSHQTLSINICGTMVGLFHGHQSGSNVMKYLQEQSAGQTALGMSDIWISGHFHNFKTMDIGERLWLQCPTVDPGSAWFRDRHGLESPPGVLTLVVGDGYNPRRDISVLSVPRSA
jgi:predicted phosphodiesterase